MGRSSFILFLFAYSCFGISLFLILHPPLYSLPTLLFALDLAPSHLYVIYFQPNLFSFINSFHQCLCLLPLGPWLMRYFYALHIMHKGMSLIIGYLSLVHLHFFHLITLRLQYGPCRKTTQRLWDQMFL